MKYLLLLIFLLLNKGSIIAQTDSSHVVNRSIYLEIGGIGGYGSINYEQSFFKMKQLTLAARVGITTYHINDFQNKFNPDLLFPLTFKISYGKKHKAEIGAGETFTFIVYADEANFKPERKLNTHTHFLIGYRYQPAKRGVMTGIAYTPILEFNRYIKHWAGVSIGYSF